MLQAQCQDRPPSRQCPSPVATDGRLGGPSAAYRVGTVVSWHSHELADSSRAQDGGGNMTLVPGPLGSCQFLQLPWPSEESLGLSTSLLHLGVSLSALASPTGKNCRPHWMEQAWGFGCSQCGWPQGRKELGTVLEGLKGTPCHGRVGSCFCHSLIPGDPLCYDPFPLPVSHSLPWTFVFCDPVVTSGLSLSPACPVLLARLGWAY